MATPARSPLLSFLVPIATLEQFATVNDAVAATTKKLEKQRLLGEYLRSIDADDDLRLATRYLAGRAFAATDERTLGVSGSIVTYAVFPRLNITAEEFHALVVRSGEIGEALSTLWPTAPDDRPPLTLAEIAASFDDLAATGSQDRKRHQVAELFDKVRLPREAAYLAKIIFGDLRTGVQDGVLQAGVAEAFGKPLADIRRATLLVGDLGEVALLARHDRLADAKFTLFHPVQFMLATPEETAADAVATMAGRMFYAEHKLDGIRAQIHKHGDRVAIYTRTMDRTDESFPDVVQVIRAIEGDFLVDGEIVPFRDGRVLPFASIQKRLGRKVLTSNLLRDYPAAFIAFDLLWLNGEPLIDQALRERRAKLAPLQLPMMELVEVSTPEQIDAAFGISREGGNEGLVLKDPESTYTFGRRGQAWLKIKTHLPTLDCVVTSAEFGHGKRRNSLSDYTFAVWDRDPGGAVDGDAKLLNVGKAYSGVTDEEIAQLTELFTRIATERHGRHFFVPPEVVLEIAFDQIQKSTRHASGYAFRFPRIKRIRWDKKPADADKLDRLIEVYNHLHNFGRSIEPPAKPAEPTLFDLLPSPRAGGTTAVRQIACQSARRS